MFMHQVLYVVGGLYGNPFALAAVEERSARERGSARILFNGDFNFFNVALSDFSTLNESISSRHMATAGNVEMEISSEHSGALGCGCGYPSYVSQASCFMADVSGIQNC